MDNSREMFEAKFPVPKNCGFNLDANEYQALAGKYSQHQSGAYYSSSLIGTYQSMWEAWQARDAEVASQKAIIDDLRLKLSGKTFSADPVAIEAARKEGFAAGVQAAAWNPIETAPKDNKRPLILAILNDDGTVRHIDYDGKWMFVSDGASDHYARSGYDWTSNQGLESPTHWIYQPTLKSQPSCYTAINTERIEALLSLIKVAQCPNHCINGAIQISETDIQQCQWCFERDNAIKEGVNNHD